MKFEIIPFKEEYKSYIKTLNVEWLEKYFAVEPNDVIQLSNPTAEIIQKGGMIYFARHQEEIVGTITLMKMDENTYELSKMAVTESFQGQGIGKALLEHGIHIAKQNSIKKLILFTNTSLETAITLYYRYGFKEVEFDATRYKRANIKMELIL